mmetsp:Transcript_59665/g.166596  ORF Transcript_59665/g.166596 Transcript_59665/m.166596 type:complete len:109 (+) Transcript_59665:950-1276(+)
MVNTGPEDAPFANVCWECGGGLCKTDAATNEALVPVKVFRDIAGDVANEALLIVKVFRKAGEGLCKVGAEMTAVSLPGKVFLERGGSLCKGGAAAKDVKVVPLYSAGG